jgi:hypothetical protein
MHCDLLLHLAAGEEGAVTARACLLEGSKLWRAGSKHLGLMLMRGTAGQDLPQGALYLHEGRVFLQLTAFMLPAEGAGG